MGSVRAARSIWSWYTSNLKKNPLMTKATSAGVLMGVSDILCQKLEEKHVAKNAHADSHHDWKRSLDTSITGFAFSGPISHGWYNLLEWGVRIESVWAGLVVRLLLDAFLFSPVAVAGYFTFRTALEGGNIRSKLEQKFRNALLASWRFWPVANMVNFSLIPIHFRVLFNNSLSCFWNGYLTHLNSANRHGAIKSTRAQTNPQKYH